MSIENTIELDLAHDDPEQAAKDVIAACAADIEQQARRMERSPHASREEAANAAKIARELQKCVLLRSDR